MATKKELAEQIAQLDTDAKTDGLNVAALETLLADLQAKAAEDAAAVEAEKPAEDKLEKADDGDLVIAYGKSIYCRKGLLKQGSPVKERYFVAKGELADHVKRGTVVPVATFKKAAAKAKANPER